MSAPPWIEALRAFAREPGALLFPLPTRSRGPVPIWADDIRASGDDDQALLELVLRCVGGARELVASYSSGQNATSTASQ